MAELLVPISVGELLDKITILEIKFSEISDHEKRANVERELRVLQAVRQQAIVDSPELDELYFKLQQVNRHLWEIEDDIRAKERAKIYDSSFIELARSVYINNDLRAQLKRRINDVTGSELVEEKSYSAG